MRKTILNIVLIAMLALGFSGCNIFENNTTSSSVLIVEDITDGNDEVPIFSNVNFPINTLAIATLAATLISPDETDSSYYQDIIVDQIDISYTRSSGQNQEGKDVPFSFTQKTNTLIEIGGTVDLPFTIIQNVAKKESPLADLKDAGEEIILKLEAHVTFHGYDVGGHRIQPATATVSVWCGNFGDEEL